MANIYIDLVLDNGESILIEAPGDSYHQLASSLDSALSRREWWAVGDVYGCRGLYRDLMVRNVDMARVIAVSTFRSARD